jgi:glutaredoxin
MSLITARRWAGNLRPVRASGLPHLASLGAGPSAGTLGSMSEQTQPPAGDWTSGLVLVTRPDCHLCEAARETVGRVAGELGVSWREESVTDHAELLQRFSEEVPVLLLDGVQRDFWTIDEARLRRLLA